MDSLYAHIESDGNPELTTTTTMVTPDRTCQACGSDEVYLMLVDRATLGFVCVDCGHAETPNYFNNKSLIKISGYKL